MLFPFGAERLNAVLGQNAGRREHSARPGSRARAIDERSGQTGFVDFETHHWSSGFAHYAADPAEHPMVGKLGPHFMDLSLDDFRAPLHGRRGAIKTFLLDQNRVAGIGNVYVQTPLWRAIIHPLRPIPTLTDDEITVLWQALRDIMQGSTPAPEAERSGVDAGGAPFELNLYGQKGGWDDPYLFHWEEGAPCPACGTPLAKIRTGSTGSYICPSCQWLESK